MGVPGLLTCLIIPLSPIHVVVIIISSRPPPEDHAVRGPPAPAPLSCPWDICVRPDHVTQPDADVTVTAGPTMCCFSAFRLAPYPLAHRTDARRDRHTNPRAGPKSVTDFSTDESTAGCECEEALAVYSSRIQLQTYSRFIPPYHIELCARCAVGRSPPLSAISAGRLGLALATAPVSGSGGRAR